MAKSKDSGRFSKRFEQFIDTTHQDVRFSLRQISRRPGFSALVALTLAVGIGGSTAIFSVLKGVVLRDLPYPEPERLVAVWETQGEVLSHQPFSGPDYFDVREQSRTLLEVGALGGRWFNLGGDEKPIRIRGARCTASLLQVLGVQPLQGRLFLEEEDAEGNDHVVILSHGIWQGQFGGEPDVVGRLVSVNGVLHEIVGIMPERFEFPTPWGGRDNTQLWAPLVIPREDSYRSSHSFGVVGRLADGATAAETEVELKAIAAQLSETYPDTNALTAMWIEPMMKRTLGSIQRALNFLLVIVGLVLLIACANIACMLLARGAQRNAEFAIRGSVGADRQRVLRQLLTESMIQSLIGGVAGFALAYWGVGVLVSILPASVPRADGIGIDIYVLGFAISATIFAGILSGLAPALFAARTEIASVLRESLLGRGGSRKRNLLLKVLVAAQIAIGLVLVNAAVLLIISYSNVLSQELNFDTDEVLVAGISLIGPAYGEPYQRRKFYEELLDRVRATPGVARAGLASKLPLLGGSNGGVLVNDEVFDPLTKRGGNLVEYSYVDDGYHEAMGIPLLAGRLLTQTISRQPAPRPVSMFLRSSYRWSSTRPWPSRCGLARTRSASLCARSAPSNITVRELSASSKMSCSGAPKLRPYPKCTFLIPARVGGRSGHSWWSEQKVIRVIWCRRFEGSFGRSTPRYRWPIHLLWRKSSNGEPEGAASRCCSSASSPRQR